MQGLKVVVRAVAVVVRASAAQVRAVAAAARVRAMAARVVKAAAALVVRAVARAHLGLRMPRRTIERRMRPSIERISQFWISIVPSSGKTLSMICQSA